MSDAFSLDKDLAIVGDYGENFGVYDYNKIFKSTQLMGTSSIKNAYSRDSFIRYYLGYEGPLATIKEERQLEHDPRVQEMPVYPDEGSIQVIDDYIVVKLNDDQE